MSESVLGALEQAAVAEVVQAIVRDDRALAELTRHVSAIPVVMKLTVDEQALTALGDTLPKRGKEPSKPRRPIGEILLGLALLLYFAAALTLAAADKSIPTAMSIVAAIVAGGLCVAVLVRTFKP
jgi:hypothetical protein